MIRHPKVWDSREVVERLAEVRREYAGEANRERASMLWSEMDALAKLADQGEDASSEWQHGETLIRDDCFAEYARELAEDFAEYARELAEDIGAVGPNASWPLSFIDWTAAADALKADYTTVDFAGVTYWVRAS